MLWYKGWLETRLRLLFVLGGMALYLLVVHTIASGRPPVGAANRIVAGVVSFAVPSFILVICLMLAGTGIATQAPFRVARGLHGSTLFTLTLPVSRFRLLAVRAGLGWLEMAGSIGALCCGLWFAFPQLSAMATVLEMLQYAETLIACASALYFLSVLAATLLDDPWRIYGTLLAGAGLEWLLSHSPLPASASIFRAMGDNSPLIAHAIPWSAEAFSLGLAAILFLAALKIVQVREY